MRSQFIFCKSYSYFRTMISDGFMECNNFIYYFVTKDLVFFFPFLFMMK